MGSGFCFIKTPPSFLHRAFLSKIKRNLFVYYTQHQRCAQASSKFGSLTAAPRPPLEFYSPITAAKVPLKAGSPIAAAKAPLKAGSPITAAKAPSKAGSPYLGLLFLSWLSWSGPPEIRWLFLFHSGNPPQTWDCPESPVQPRSAVLPRH